MVENIRVIRFVIDGFSGAGVVGASAAFAGSVGGAACPLVVTLELPETALPFCEKVLECADPPAEEAREGVGDGLAFSATSESLGEVTVAMLVESNEVGTTFGTGCAESKEVTAKAEWAMPVVLTVVGGTKLLCAM